MITEAFAEALAARIKNDEDSGLSLAQLCAASTEVTLLWTSIVVSMRDHPRATMAATPEAAAVEGLQFALGEGPGFVAQAEGRPVLVENLAASSFRWVQFVPAARALGIGAVFSFPLKKRVGGTGVLSLYADHVHPLSDLGLIELATVADLVSDMMQAMESRVAPTEPAWSLMSADHYRTVVHQATGMVAVQLGVSTDEALSCLLARAFAHDLTVEEVARQVVDRQLRLDL